MGRFIPAGAGNGRSGQASRFSKPVHPRRRGERSCGGEVRCDTGGSSPQARGTAVFRHHCPPHRRFIPAGAGNGSVPVAAYSAGSVHPRRRGERAVEQHQRGGLGRFIPAGAGNGPRSRPGPPPSAVHPRRRGERHLVRREFGEDGGSSPQARGTDGAGGAAVVGARFIPAGAGNGGTRRTATRPAAVHPRRRGERATCTRPNSRRSGSSPQARGTGSNGRGVGEETRFIPAGAGNGNQPHFPAHLIPVHPRRRGERARSACAAISADGSSPQARGTAPGR